MEGSSFDRLARMISADASRRGALRSAFVAALAGLGVRSLLGAEDAEAKSCQKRCKKKKNKNARKQCLKRCNASQGQGKAAGALCDTTGECANPNICSIPVNDSGGDKRCCAPAGAPCGLKDPDTGDDTAPFCCRGNTCTSTPTSQGTCQPTP